MVSREAFNVIAEELNYTFAQEYGEKFPGIVVFDAFTDELLYFGNDQKIVVNYIEWIDQYPYLDLDEYKSFIEEKIRKEILKVNNAQG